MLLRTLGKLELEGSDTGAAKPLLLLAYLALSGPQPRRRVGVLFWPDASDPLNRLSVTLSRLRKLAPRAVLADAERVGAQLHVDAFDVLRALDDGDVANALARYTGAFLEGVYPRDIGVELEEWILATRESLAQRVQAAALAHAEELAGDGRFAAR